MAKGNAMNEPDQYFLGYRTAEQERLQRQADELAAESAWLFDTIGSLQGKRALEIGCGPRGCLDQLSERVGPSGRVVGLERSPETVELAKRFVAERGLPNVEVLCGDAKASNLPSAGFDLVTARLVLVNVPHPEQVVSEAARLARSGGQVAFHEADWVAFMCDPPSRGWTAIVDSFIRYSEANGIDLFVGRKLPRLLRTARLADVSVRPIIYVRPPGHPSRPLLLAFADNLKDRMIAAGLLTEAGFADLRQDLVRSIADPETCVVHGPFFQAWARKP
jgi:SAM-dependent methyltransferase